MFHIRYPVRSAMMNVWPGHNVENRVLSFSLLTLLTLHCGAIFERRISMHLRIHFLLHPGFMHVMWRNQGPAETLLSQLWLTRFFLLRNLNDVPVFKRILAYCRVKDLYLLGVMAAQWTVFEPRSDTNFCSVHGPVRFSVPFVHFLQVYVDFLEAFVLSHNVKVVSRLHRCYYLFMRRCAAWKEGQLFTDLF